VFVSPLTVELSSDDEIDDSVLNQLGNGDSKAGFISRRSSMTAELETRLRHARLSEGSDLDRQSGPSSPSTAPGKWGLFGMNWQTQSKILADRNTPPQETQPPLSPLALFQPSPFNPPAPTQVPTSNVSPGYSQTGRSRFPPPSQPVDPQRVQRSQSFSIGDHGFGGNPYPQTTQTNQTGPAPVGHRSSIFAVHSNLSPLARNSIDEEGEFEQQLTGQEDGTRYVDRGRSLSTSAASHGFSRPRGDTEDVTDEVLYEEDEEGELEPLSRSRTLPENMPSSIPGMGFPPTRYSGLSTERERLERQRGAMRQSPRVSEEIPTANRRPESFSQSTTWDEPRLVRSPPRGVDFPAQATYDAYESGQMLDSPGSIHSFPGVRDYPPVPPDVQNYFNNDHDRRRIAEQQFQYYQMQSRFRGPVSYPSPHESQRGSFQFHDPEQYTLHIVKFKANRMDVFYLSKEKKLDLQVKDYVIVDGDRGTDLGMVSKVNVSEAEARSLTAQLQREQAAATAANQNGMNANAIEAIAAAANQVQERDVTIPKKFIHRLAVRGEIDGLQMKMQDEAQAKQVCEMKVQQRGLQMDILDVEYQWYVAWVI
jgi:PSP1 C-terminal conserved region